MAIVEKVLGHLYEASQVLPDVAQGDFYTFDVVITNATGALGAVNPLSITVPSTHDFLMHGISGHYQMHSAPAAPAVDTSGIPLITVQVNYQGGDKGRIFNQAFNMAQIIGSTGQNKELILPMHFLFPASSVISVVFALNTAAAWAALALTAVTKTVGVQLIGTLIGKGIKVREAEKKK